MSVICFIIGPEVNYAMLGSGAEKPRHNHRNNNSSSSINNGTSGGGGGGGNGNKPQQQSSSSASSVGAVGLPEQRMSAALHSMSAETAHLQEQYHSNERRIDDMLVRTHRELSSSSTGALARSAAKSPFPRSASPTAPGSTGRPSATSTAQKQPFSSHQKQHYDDDDDSGDGDADEEGDYLYDKFSSDALRSSHHHQQQQHHTSSGAGSAWDDGSYSVDTAVAGAGAGGEGN